MLTHTLTMQASKKAAIAQRETDGYVNATALCKAADKRWNDYYRLKTSKNFIEALASDTGIPASQLTETRKGNSKDIEQGTWVHPQVAVHLAQWLSPEFAVQVSKWVVAWIGVKKEPEPSPDRPLYQPKKTAAITQAIAQETEWAAMELIEPCLDEMVEATMDEAAQKGFLYSLANLPPGLEHFQTSPPEEYAREECRVFATAYAEAYYLPSEWESSYMEEICWAAAIGEANGGLELAARSLSEHEHLQQGLSSNREEAWRIALDKMAVEVLGGTERVNLLLITAIVLDKYSPIKDPALPSRVWFLMWVLGSVPGSSEDASEEEEITLIKLGAVPEEIASRSEVSKSRAFLCWNEQKRLPTRDESDILLASKYFYFSMAYRPSCPKPLLLWLHLWLGVTNSKISQLCELPAPAWAMSTLTYR